MFDETAPELLRLATHLVSDLSLAEDLVQSTFLAAIEGCKEYTPRRPVLSWLTGILTNHARELRRKAYRRPDPERLSTNSVQEPHQQVVATEFTEAVSNAIAGLPHPYRPVLLMHLKHGQPVQEIALVLERAPGTVRKQLLRGLQMLRKALPPGLAVGIAGSLLPDCGLAAVRRTVLARASTASIPAVTTALLGGSLLMKPKLLVAGIGMAAALLALWFVVPIPPSVPRPIAQSDVSSPLVAHLSEPEPEVTPPSADRQVLASRADNEPAVGEELASLLVRLTWHDTKDPAVGLPLRVSRDSDLNWTLTFEPAQLAVTGPDGTILLSDLQPGRFTIRSNRPFHGDDGVSKANDAFDLHAGEAKILEHEIASGIDIEGRVVDRHGTGVAGARVLAMSPTIPQRTFPIANTDGSGSFFVRGASSLLGAQAEGLGTSDFILVSSRDYEPGRPGILTLRLPDDDPAELRGQIFDPDGQPVPRALVAVGNDGTLRTLPGGIRGQSPPRVHLQADDEGRFQVGELRPGPTTVRVYARGLAPWDGRVEIHPLESAMLRIDLQAGASISGQVLNSSGKAVQRVQVWAEPGDYPFTGGSSITDVQGRYSLRDLPSGEFTVSVFSHDHARVERAFTLAGTQQIRWDVTLDVGLSIRGVLRDHNGQPLEGWGLGRDGGRFAAKTDSEGRFTIVNCEERAYTLSVYMDGEDAIFPALFRFEDMWPGNAEHDLTVPESALPSAYVEGRVLMPNGRAASEASASLRQGRWPMGPTVKTDALGRFVIGPVSPGEYRLRSSLRGLVPADFGDFTLLPLQRLDLGARMLQHGGHLTVTIQAVPEQTEDLSVVLLDLEEDRTIRTGRLTEGEAVFRMVPQGSYRLSISGPHGQVHEQTVEVQAQETANVKVILH